MLSNTQWLKWNIFSGAVTQTTDYYLLSITIFNKSACASLFKPNAQQGSSVLREQEPSNDL